MKTLNKDHKRKRIAIIVIVLAVLAICGIITWWFFIRSPVSNGSEKNTGVNYGKPSLEQKKAGDQIKSNASKQGSTSGSDQPSPPTPIPGSNQKQVGVTITAAQPSDSSYLVRTDIGTVTNTGTCTLIMEKPGSPAITMSAGTQALSSTSTCKGFNIPLSSVSPGVWSLTIKFTDNDLVGSATKQVSV